MKFIKLAVISGFFLMISSLFAKAAPDNGFIVSNGSGSKLRPFVENRVHKAGNFWLNMTNHGVFGNPDNSPDPCSGEEAVSGEFPGGSGTDYLFLSSMMFGGYLNQTEPDSITNASVFEGPYVSTADEGWTGENGGNDRARECWAILFDEDELGTTLGKINETSNVEGKISCLFEDVYDPLASAEEEYSSMFTDKWVERVYSGYDDYDRRPHVPLGLEVKQKSYAWSYDYAKKFVIVDYTIYNRNTEGKDIYDFFIGFYNDFDIGSINTEFIESSDDIGGFIETWDNYIDPATGEQSSIDLDLVWAADNDGRNLSSEIGSIGFDVTGDPLDGATGVASLRVLRNPNPNMKYSFNMYAANSIDEAIDWGPRWVTGLHNDWEYDLTMSQKGYDDTNYDDWGLSGDLTGGTLLGGRTEGRPCSDSGRYMVMSNSEIDYNQTAIREVYLGYDQQQDGTMISQADRWQKYTTNDDVGNINSGFADYVDGNIEDMNNLASGADVKSLMSFGPLGNETSVNLAVDVDSNGIADTNINKKAWKFAYGDSLKLTIAFIVSDNFHTSTDQNPYYENENIIDMSDGLDTKLFSRGWYDAMNNVIWAERMYDIPMYDTPVTYNGETKGDGWYGEDVGKDGLFGDIDSDTVCWWIDQDYTGPDEGESDFKLTDFDHAITDIYGHTASSEDDILPLGREIESSDGLYGVSQNYGYMVQYSQEGGTQPLGTWVRYGYDNGRLDAGDGVPDFAGPLPPSSPKINAYFEDNDVVVKWNSHEFYTLQNGDSAYSGPEHDHDKFTRINDFESYTIKVSPNSQPDNFVDLVTIDIDNYVYENVGNVGEYLDIPVSKAEYDSLLAEGENIITENDKVWELRPFGNNRGLLNGISNDAFEFSATPHQIILNGNEIQTYDYEIRLINKYLEGTSYISVVSSDFGDPDSGVPPLTSSVITNMKKVGELNDEITPFTTQLMQNYPNPFNPSTKIWFSLSNDSHTELTVYNSTGQVVEKLLNKNLQAGLHQVNFKAEALNSGLYFYTLKSNNRSFTKKMLILK